VRLVRRHRPRAGGRHQEPARLQSQLPGPQRRDNADDYFRIDQGFLAQPANPNYRQGDFNYDGRINADDYFQIDRSFLGQGAVLSSSLGSSISAVPEPGTLLVVGLLCGAITGRRGEGRGMRRRR
jgi:hypothetical protein